MKPFGHGVDVIDLAQIRRSLARDEEAFVGWFSAWELTKNSDQLSEVKFLASRIAAKEAVAKALGTGFADDVSWQDIEIGRTEHGALRVSLSDGAAEAARRAGIAQVFVSISHSETTAIASAIATGI